MLRRVDEPLPRHREAQILEKHPGIQLAVGDIDARHGRAEGSGAVEHLLVAAIADLQLIEGAGVAVQGQPGQLPILEGAPDFPEGAALDQ